MSNDIHIIAGIMTFFVLLGVFLPFVQTDFGISQTAYNAESIVQESDLDEAGSDISAFDVVASVAKMFFWTFGALPAWMDALFLVLRITLVLTVARNVWIGGGG